MNKKQKELLLSIDMEEMSIDEFSILFKKAKKLYSEGKTKEEISGVLGVKIYGNSLEK